MLTQSYCFSLLSLLTCLIHGNSSPILLNHNNGINNRYQAVSALQLGKSVHLKTRNENLPAWNLLKASYSPISYQSSGVSNPNSVVVFQIPETQSTSATTSYQAENPMAYRRQTSSGAQVVYSSNIQSTVYKAVSASSSLATTPNRAIEHSQITPITASTTAKPVPERSSGDATTRLQLCLQSLQNFAQLQHIGIESLRYNRFQQPRLPFLGQVPNTNQVKICLQQINSN